MDPTHPNYNQVWQQDCANVDENLKTLNALEAIILNGIPVNKEEFYEKMTSALEAVECRGWAQRKVVEFETTKNNHRVIPVEGQPGSIKFVRKWPID